MGAVHCPHARHVTDDAGAPSPFVSKGAPRCRSTEVGASVPDYGKDEQTQR